MFAPVVQMNKPRRHREMFPVSSHGDVAFTCDAAVTRQVALADDPGYD